MPDVIAIPANRLPELMKRVDLKPELRTVLQRRVCPCGYITSARTTTAMHEAHRDHRKIAHADD